MFNRPDLKGYGPQIPTNYVFAEEELLEFMLVKRTLLALSILILIQDFNGMMMTRASPPINRLYETPRAYYIDNFIQEWLKVCVGAFTY